MTITSHGELNWTLTAQEMRARYGTYAEVLEADERERATSYEALLGFVRGLAHIETPDPIIAALAKQALAVLAGGVTK
jgi:hypothetical protein